MVFLKMAKSSYLCAKKTMNYRCDIDLLWDLNIFYGSITWQKIKSRGDPPANLMITPYAIINHGKAKNYEAIR